MTVFVAAVGIVFFHELEFGGEVLLHFAVDLREGIEVGAKGTDKSGGGFGAVFEVEVENGGLDGLSGVELEKHFGVGFVVAEIGFGGFCGIKESFVSGFK